MGIPSPLALFGGPPAIRAPLAPYRSIGPEEVAAATRVVSGGVLSKFLGSWAEDFHGGPEVRAFEAAWREAFGVSHAVAVNSATSGLIAALGAIGLEPGDEVIVSPWTMCASATAILVWNAIPVFADIGRADFNLDPAAVERAITPLTRAIVVPDIFGQCADLEAILALARARGLKVVEDAAQAPGAHYRARFAGTWADIGVFSLNYHKHIHTGEGGVCVTNDARLAERMQLIRNHAEAVVGGKGVTDLSNMIGFNFRPGEIEAAIGVEQLAKLPAIADRRGRIGALLNDGLAGLAGLTLPVPLPGRSHVYYMYGMILDSRETGVTRERLIEALAAEGVPDLRRGYVNVHRLPMYRQKIAFGSRGFPWSGGVYRGQVCYDDGTCPVAEELHDRSLFSFYTSGFRLDDAEVAQVVEAFRKVWGQLPRLR